jgi:hypothetical protein
MEGCARISPVIIKYLHAQALNQTAKYPSGYNQKWGSQLHQKFKFCHTHDEVNDVDSLKAP